MSNLLFSRHAQVVELLPGSRLYPHCYYLTKSRGLTYHYIKAPDDELGLDEVERLSHEVTVDVNALETLLARILEVDGEPGEPNAPAGLSA